MERRVTKVGTITQCNKLFSEQTLHPLISLVTPNEENCGKLLQMGFYSVLLKENPSKECGSACGWRECDFSEATMIFLPPWKTINCNRWEGSDKNKLLCFHPDLIWETSLEGQLNKYSFFNYRHTEALHLSHKETEIVKGCLNGILDELNYGLDEFSKSLICNKIETLLNYCARFYNRQFITRCEENKKIESETGKLIECYFISGKGAEKGLPDADYLARAQNLSAAYLDDLLYHQSGMRISEYVQFKRVMLAKALLLRGRRSIVDIADMLSYNSMQNFVFLFKKLTGYTPVEYRTHLEIV